jgi:hypothetical protein
VPIEDPPAEPSEPPMVVAAAPGRRAQQNAGATCH